MTKGKNKVFTILKGFIPTEKRGLHAFLSTGYEEAKLYAENWVEENHEYGYFSLYQIGNIDNGELKEEKILIKPFWHTNNIEYSKKAEIRRVKEEYEKAKNEKEMKDIIKILFRATEVGRND